MNNKFPVISELVKFKSSSSTETHKILMKVIDGGILNENEERKLDELLVFYNHVIEFLKNIDLQSISKEDEFAIFDFCKKVFVFSPVIAYDKPFEKIYRASLNKKNIKNSERINNTIYLTYPKSEITTKYGRANLPYKPMFYASFEEKVAVLEVFPEVGDIVTVSEWKLNNSRKTTIYPISNDFTLINRNQFANKSNKAFQELIKHTHEKLFKIFDLITSFFSSEYSKSIGKKKETEYLFSAFLTNQLLYEQHPDTNISGIIYPSVSAKHSLENIVLLPSFVDKSLHISKVTELLITNAEYFDAIEKTKIDVSVLAVAKEIDTNGNIKWINNKKNGMVQ